ncbi:hypothetical protein [Phaeocystidibacter luteus]|uniref:Lipocalin-like domain-containing protein n=1 Tax=Phaeocystidibacter luteus TaxID=911197 RepID=A0A6N6RK02_9FLAO|nr:hypothetical protein [Phaeocystidibacter luteus]KAB2814185.1 hypothetical protein F8C67_00205 [Phaeocystidibacter luteus]
MSLLRTTLLSAVLLSAISCNLDGFPNKEDLVGTWVEAEPYSDVLTFRGNGSLIRTIDGVTDTIIYRTDGDRGVVIFTDPSNAGFGELEYPVLMLSEQKHMLLEGYRSTSSQSADGEFFRR